MTARCDTLQAAASMLLGFPVRRERSGVSFEKLKTRVPQKFVKENSRSQFYPAHKSGRTEAEIV